MYLSDPTILVLLSLSTIGLMIHNNTVTVAVLILLIMRLTPMIKYFPWLEKEGLNIGIIILTICVLSPIASGSITTTSIINSLYKWQSLLAIFIGVVVSWLGGRGTTLMSNDPSIISGLLVGTIIGVAFFNGIPVGPLIAAGLLSLLIDKYI